LFTTINSALGMFLAIAVIVLLVRKLLMGDVDNYNGAIIPIVLVLSLIGLICNLIVCAGTAKLDLINMSSEEYAQIKNHNIISLVIGYVSLSLDYIIFKIIEKKNKKEQPKQENHWDLDKFK
jgi:hypothetical protein